MPETIDLEKARQLLKAAVETQGGDFVYNVDGNGSCFYKPEESDPRLGADGAKLDINDPRRKTGCLIGVALTLHGETRHLNSFEAVEGVFRDNKDMMTFEAMRYFSYAQTKQDNGSTWGEAYRSAELSLPR